MQQILKPRVLWDSSNCYSQATMMGLSKKQQAQSRVEWQQ
jgi:hypothetical protein